MFMEAMSAVEAINNVLRCCDNIRRAKDAIVVHLNSFLRRRTTEYLVIHGFPDFIPFPICYSSTGSWRVARESARVQIVWIGLVAGYL